MPQETSAPLLEEIIRALGEKVGTEVSIATLEEELNRYLEYRVPPEQARNTILRHYGVQPPRASGGQGRKTLAELQGNEPFVNLLVRVVAINEKEIAVKGEPRRIQYGIFGDETLTRPFTAWRPLEAETGDVLKILGAYTKEYQGEPQINLGDRCVVEKGDPESLPRGPSQARALGLSDLRPGQGNVDATVRILTIGSRDVTAQGVAKTVWSGTVGDASGKAAFTAWHDFQLKPGDVVRIRGGYVRGWRGTPQLTFDEKATVEVVPDATFPGVAEIENAGPVPLADLFLGGGQLDVTVEATLVEVRPGSGLVLRCPTCKRVTVEDECRTHGKVAPVLDLRIKGVLDDGTGALSVIFGRELTEALTGRTLADYQGLAKEALTSDVVDRDLKSKLLARPLRVRGNVLVDEFGPSMIAREAALLQRDLAAAAEALLAELEEAA